MFSADLSWTESNVEKVGQRRERKARERSSTAGSIKTTTSSKSSVSADRELWWTSGLKKAKGLQSNILRPSSNRSSNSQKGTHSIPPKLDLKTPPNLKDPTLQPPWTYATTLSPTLPSGATFDLPVNEVPELEGDTSSRRTTSSEVRFSREQPTNTVLETPQLTSVAEERRWEVQTPAKVRTIEEESQHQGFTNFSAKDRGEASSAATGRYDLVSTPSPCWPTQGKRQEKPSTTPSMRLTIYRSPCPVMIEGALSFEALELHDAFEDATALEKSIQPLRLDARPCPPLSQWESLKPRGIPKEVQVTPKPMASKVAVAHSSTLELTRFQRFIRRMESAGPRTVLDRLKEEWPESEEEDEELALEKQLWLLTGLQMQHPRVVPKPMCATGKILELYGNLSEVFQISAMHPDQTVHFLTNKAQRPITLPANVSYLTVRDCGAVPLPYPEDYFSHIRASTLPSLVPSSKLPELFRECYKLLAPGGLLEIRNIDVAPVRKTAGPLLRMWIEDRLSVSLEKLFRCSKPCLLVPGWLADAGFNLTASDGSNVNLPCAFDASSADVDKELSTIIGRSLWRDTWGSSVDEVPGEPKWFWEDEDIIKECLERQTVFECRTILAHKR